MTYEEEYSEDTVRRMEELGLSVPVKEYMTCDRCLDADTCLFAWDRYNTGGDCLADK